MAACKQVVELVVLGAAQDGGFPQVLCTLPCCSSADTTTDDTSTTSIPRKRGLVTCIGVRADDELFLFDATPDLPEQVKLLARDGGHLAGIFLTHAHIGHYLGLVYLGREAANLRELPTYAMPRMSSFLRDNAPFSQLVALGNVKLEPLRAGSAVELAAGALRVTPVAVPHRGEFSETVGYVIRGPSRAALFVPDIDSWSQWEVESGKTLAEHVAEVDVAFLDATFYSGDSSALRGAARDLKEVPHPLVVDSMQRLAEAAAEERSKVHFLHFNHTNPLLDPSSDEAKEVVKRGFRIATLGQRIGL